MANNIWSNYTEKTATPVDADEVMVRDSTDGKNKRLLFGAFWKWVAKKLNEATISELQTNNKTVIGAINALNTNLGKTARFYAVSNFYVPGSSGDYSGLAIGGTAWNNIAGIQYVSATDYKHYYTFLKGTYLVNINLFANLEASTSNVLGVALNIEVDGKAIANPWFRMIDSYQSISYPVIINGSKLKVTMYSGKTIEIVNNANLSYVDFMRLN
jgi:hypothetical protein|nr:MAG TPA: hypothetical protein [Caudoviricetes sp.]